MNDTPELCKSPSSQDSRAQGSLVQGLLAQDRWGKWTTVRPEACRDIIAREEIVGNSPFLKKYCPSRQFELLTLCEYRRILCLPVTSQVPLLHLF